MRIYFLVLAFILTTYAGRSTLQAMDDFSCFDALMAQKQPDWHEANLLIVEDLIQGHPQLNLVQFSEILHFFVNGFAQTQTLSSTSGLSLFKLSQLAKELQSALGDPNFIYKDGDWLGTAFSFGVVRANHKTKPMPTKVGDLIAEAKQRFFGTFVENDRDMIQFAHAYAAGALIQSEFKRLSLERQGAREYLALLLVAKRIFPSLMDELSHFDQTQSSLSIFNRDDWKHAPQRELAILEPLCN